MDKVRHLWYLVNFLRKYFNSRSEHFQKKKDKEEQLREANTPMKNCVLKFDHFENIHR